MNEKKLKPGPRTYSKKTEKILFYMDEGTRAMLEKLAYEQETSMSAVIRFAVNNYIRHKLKEMETEEAFGESKLGINELADAYYLKHYNCTYSQLKQERRELDNENIIKEERSN